MATVAIIGADGSGKSTVCRALIRNSQLPLKYVYMGVNLDAGSVMLPTTRLIRWLKRRHSPSAVSRASGPAQRLDPPSRSLRRELKSLLRTGHWLTEEWCRQLSAWVYELRGYIVIFDRHFYADYFFYDVAPKARSRLWGSRIHGFMLERLYPKPDLFILLSAPPEILFARKKEDSVEFLRERQAQYLRLKDRVGRFEIVDATRPQDAVIEEVETLIRRLVEV